MSEHLYQIHMVIYRSVALLVLISHAKDEDGLSVVPQLI